MQNIFQHRKAIGLTVLISTFLLCLPQSPARAVMLTTEYIIHQDSKQLFARARVKAFLRRTEVTAQMQAYGIHLEEALARVDSLTDTEIVSLSGMMDQISARAGGTYALDGGLLMFIGMAMYAIVAAILIYFSFYSDKEEKPE